MPRGIVVLTALAAAGCSRTRGTSGDRADAAVGDGDPVVMVDAPDGRDDAGDDCLARGLVCSYYHLVDPLHATLRDQQSYRQVVADYCVTTTEVRQVVQDLCAYQDTCQQQGTQASCIPCGELGRNTLQRTLDGAITDDCAGCQCHGWAVYGCLADTTNTYRQPFVDLVFQSAFHDGTTILRLAVAASGSLLNPTSFATNGTLVSYRATPTTIDIRSGGLIELDLDLQANLTVAGGATQAWHVTSHIVRRCP